MRAARFDFGRSLAYDRPVADLVPERAANTALLATAALIVSTLIGLPLGVITGSRRGVVRVDRARGIARPGVDAAAADFARARVRGGTHRVVAHRRHALVDAGRRQLLRRREAHDRAGAGAGAADRRDVRAAAGSGAG